jgi:apolipoprotein N-acyltransferase
MSALLKKYNGILILPLLTGIMVGTSYVPFLPWALLWSWIPLWWAASKEVSFKRIFWQGWLAQFILSLIGFHWVAFVSHEFGYMPWWLSALVLLAFAALVHLHIPLSLVAARWLQLKFRLSKSSFFVLCAGLLALGEFYWPSLFQWHMGYTLLWIKSSVSQWADVIGFQGLSFMILLCNAILAMGTASWLETKNYRKILAGSFLILVGILVLTWSGSQRKIKWKNPPEKLNVLTVQANIGNLEKMAAQLGQGFQDEIIAQYLRLTNLGLHQEGHTKVDLVMWPESAFPSYLDPLDLQSPYAQKLAPLLSQEKVSLLTGGYSHQVKIVKGRAKDFQYNALFLLNSETHLQSPPYHKTQLLAFGEYMPFEDIFPVLASLNPNGGSFERGQGPMIMNLNLGDQQIPIGTQICYESLDPDFTRSLSHLGAFILFNGTNDSWFGPRSEPEQHMIMTLARAIEIRRPLVRSTNTGITTAILADGTRLESSPVGEEWTHVFEVSYQKNPETTFFAKFGNYLPIFMVFITLLAVSLLQLLESPRETRK